MDAQEGLNDAGEFGWLGPKPPSGKHRYEFHFYALNSIIDLPAESNKIDLRKIIKDKIIEETSLTGLYEDVK